ncbi:MAG: hypothetical protein AAF628_06495 [Planctomycetota bacterium]
MQKRIAVALATVGLTAWTVPAQNVGFRDVLPANTILYVGAPDLDTTLAEASESPLIRMWREAEVQDFFADALKMGGALWDEKLAEAREAFANGEMPFDPDELMKLRLDSVGLALTGLGLTQTDGEPLPKVGMVMHVDFGASAPAWRKLIDFGVGMMMQEAGDDLTRHVASVGDVELVTLVPPETEMSMNMAFVGSGMVFGTLTDEVKSVLGRLADGKSALSTSEAFAATFSKLDTDGAELEFWMQPQPAIDFALEVLQMAKDEAPDFPQQLDIAGIGRAIDALGLRGLKGVGSTATYRPHDASGAHQTVSKSFAFVPDGQRKGLLAATGAPVDLGFLRWVPKDVASFSALSFDLDSVWSSLENAVKAYDEQMGEQLLGMLAMYEQQFGLSLEKDLIGSVGDQMITWSMPVAALGTTPELALLLEVRDQERLLKTLDKIAELSDGMFEIDASERRGITVHQIQINWDPTGGMGINPLDMFVPTFSFKDGWMVAGFSTGDVKRVFKRMDREDDPAGDIRGNTEFKPYLAQLPESVNAVSFSDWKANFEGIYQMVTSMAAFIPVDDDIPIDLSLLPDVSTLTQHLFGSVSWSTIEKDGFHTLAMGPWGPEAMLLLTGAVGGIAGAVAGNVQGDVEFR